MMQKPLSDVTLQDLNELVANAVPEGRSIEFKQALCVTTDSDKKEFLADVSSFANSSGGDILYGVEEANGVASSITGLDELDKDSATLRLESAIRDGVDPRIPGIQLHWIDVNDRPVLVLRIPKSWACPHMVTYKNSSRFFSRGSAGKFQLDVAEIRAAFDSSGLIGKRIAEWRADRIGKVVTGEGVFPMKKRGVAVVHVVPIAHFDEAKYSAAELNSPQLNFSPIDANGWSRRLNLDGVVYFSGTGDAANTITTYTQVFRSSSIEAVTSHLISEHEESRFVASVAYEKNIIQSVDTYLTSLKTLRVPPPYVLMISLLGVKDAFMHVRGDFHDRQNAFDRDVILVPGLIIEDLHCDVANSLRPAFDIIWNACGYFGSRNFDENGNWNPK